MEEEKDYYEGFIEWHNERTVNPIDTPEECQCNLKDDWKKLKESSRRNK